MPCNANCAYFDGAQLFRERFAYFYEYDDNGRIESVTDLVGNKTEYTYRDNSSDITKIKLTNGVEFSYDYDEDSNLLTKTTSATGVETSYSYDSYGNVKTTTVSYANNNGPVIQTDQEYTTDGNFLKSVTGTDRNKVTYTYNPEKSTLSSERDAEGNETVYDYDAMRRLESSTAGNMSVSYEYDNDRLSSITHSGGANNTTYNFGYTTAGLTDTVKVGNTGNMYTLVTNVYNSGTWTLKSQTYGNGDAWRYTYNEFDDLVSSYTTGGTTGTELKYFYNSEGALARIEQYDTTLSANTITARTLVSTERYYYDTADRMIRITRTDEDGDTYSCSWEYDHNDNVTKLVEKTDNLNFNTRYTYDDDNRVSTVTNRSKTFYTYDDYGRLGSRSTVPVQTQSADASIITDNYAYCIDDTGDTDFTTNQIATWEVTTGSKTTGGKTTSYDYEYDKNGNIITIDDGTNETTYEYDSANQLTRENNQAAGKTWIWTYDKGGNILSRKEYNYTTGTLGTALSTYAYTYGDTAWGDLLTKYRGTTLQYDEIGNLTNDGTWTYTWENGRQLSGMSNGSTTWSYEYGPDGLCTGRSNGSVTYEYIYSGDNLIQMTVGDNPMVFSYEGSKPVWVMYDMEIYFYVTNIQGDIIAITDGTGNRVVEYTYDAWGNILSITGTKKDTLGAANPLRYRGYVYDTETGLYYLQSRYYDPEMGRFINADGFASTGQGIVGNNMFAYCCNNPIQNVDPSGYLCAIHAGAIGEYHAYITDQTAEGIGEKSLGLASVAHSGCGVIASYNALLSMGDFKNFDEVLQGYNAQILSLHLWGYAGMFPKHIKRYFRSLGYTVTVTSDQTLIEELSKNADACIMYYEFPYTYTWLDCISIGAYGAHFVEYSRLGTRYIARNTSENNGLYGFYSPIEYGYNDSRNYMVGIFIFK